MFALGVSLIASAAHAMDESGVAPGTIQQIATGGTCEPTTIKTNQSDSCMLPDTMVIVSPDAMLKNGDDVIRTNFDELISNPNALAVDPNSTIVEFGASVVTECDGKSAPYWFGPQTSSDKFLIADPVMQIRLPENVEMIRFKARQQDSMNDVSKMKLLLLADDGALVNALDEKSTGFFTTTESTEIVEQGSVVVVQSATPFRSVIVENPSAWLMGELYFSTDPKH